MKYTILGFQQDKANDLKLNVNDLLLMRTIKDMYSSAGMEFIIENGDKYIWVKQDYLHEQIPIIGSKRTMLRIINKLVDLDLLKNKVKHTKGKVKGTFYYIKPTVKMDKLQDYEPYDKLSMGGRQSVKRGMTKCHSKDTSITDTSIKDTSTSSTSLTESFEEVWKLYPNKKGKKKAIASYKRAIKNGTTQEEVIDGIERYKKHLANNEWLKPAHGSTWFNNNRWEDEYSDNSAGGDKEGLYDF